MIAQDGSGIGDALAGQSRAREGAVQRTGQAGREHGLVHHRRRGAVLVPAVFVKPAPVQMLAVQEVDRQSLEPMWCDHPPGVRVDGDESGDVEGEDQPELLTVQRPGRGDFHSVRQPVQAAEGARGGTEHARTRGHAGQPGERLDRSVSVVGVQGGTHGRPRVRRARHHQDAHLDAIAVQQGVLEEPGERGQAPPVGIVDDQQQTVARGQCEVLAPSGDGTRIGAMERGGRGPALRSGHFGEFGREPALPLPSGCVKPADSKAGFAVTPSLQPTHGLVAQDEGNQGTPSVEHPARQIAQPAGLCASRTLPSRKQVERGSASRDVKIRADHSVREPVHGGHVLYHPAGQATVPRDHAQCPSTPGAGTGAFSDCPTATLDDAAW
ncbi:hypothetical protein ACFVHW_25435 [Streptomyces sp. NPDC127110]|uniref:hypothetical protein n=1 Tax=Streptomyces sp. NPDC127110 TaxID=3345362 RepID=UPI003633B1C5